MKGRSGTDSKQSGGKLAKLGLRWGMFADLAQKKIEGGTFGGSFGATLGVRWGKGADLAPKKVAEGTFEAQVGPERAKGSHLEADFGPKFAPRGGQDSEVGAKMAASWGQEGAKRAKRRLETRSWNEKLDFESCRVSLEKRLFLRYRVG